MDWSDTIIGTREASSLSRHDVYFQQAKRVRGIYLTTEEIEMIKRYLRNPTEVGIYKLKAKWNPDGSISQVINQYVENFIRSGKKLSITYGRRTLEFDPEKDSNILNQIHEYTKKLSFLLSLFAYIYTSDRSKSEESIDILKRDLERWDTIDIILFELIDIDDIKSKYGEAYRLYVENIFQEDGTQSVYVKDIFKFMKGNIVLDAFISDTVSISSLDYNSVILIKDFLKELNQINDERIERYFSPEEIIFEPYMVYLQSTYPKITEYDTLRRLIEASISEYRNNNYQLCINKMGIMAEDILIQIYETLFRQEAEENLTLGQTYDTINKKAKDLLSSDGENPRVKADDLFKEINEILENTTSSSNEEIQIKTLELIRKSIQYLKEQNQHMENTINKTLHTENKNLIFPKNIRSKFNELLRYRNATSHKSRIPLGPYEATRTVYCAMVLLMWWDQERLKIDWENSKEDIIRDIITRNRQT